MANAAPVPVRIRESALKLFAERGFDATGIRDIAELAAIPTSLLYHYRRSKQEILRDLVLDGLGRHVESSRRALELTRSPEEELRALVAVHVLVPIRNPEMARVMENEVRSLSGEWMPEVQARRSEGDQRWERVLRHGAADGVFTVPDFQLGRRLLRRMCTGIHLWYTPSPDLPVETLVLRLTDHALAFVRARRAGADVRAEEVVSPAIEAVQRIVDEVHDRG